MNNIFKNTLALIAVLLTSTTAFAATGSTMPTSTGSMSTGSTTAQADKFSMKDVSVVDAKTLKISFNKDLLEDTSMFEFLLTSKKDDTKEITLTGTTLSSSKEVTVNTTQDLLSNEDYNLVVVFASDKEGKLIENGVDGMVTFKTPTVFSAATPDMNAAPTTVTPAVDAVPTTEAPTVSTPESSSGAVKSADVAAGEAKALPKTGAEEMIVVFLALVLALGLMFIRKRA